MKLRRLGSSSRAMPLLVIAMLAATVALTAGCAGGEARACKQNCPIEVVLVCGQDGKEYDNECTAKCYGTEKKYDGPCKPMSQSDAGGGGDDD